MLARAFRWRKMLDDGVYATLDDLARGKGVNATYVSRILRLALLAPDIVAAATRVRIRMCCSPCGEGAPRAVADTQGARVIQESADSEDQTPEEGEGLYEK